MTTTWHLTTDHCPSKEEFPGKICRFLRLQIDVRPGAFLGYAIMVTIWGKTSTGLSLLPTPSAKRGLSFRLWSFLHDIRFMANRRSRSWRRDYVSVTKHGQQGEKEVLRYVSAPKVKLQKPAKEQENLRARPKNWNRARGDVAHDYPQDGFGIVDDSQSQWVGWQWHIYVQDRSFLQRHQSISHRQYQWCQWEGTWRLEASTRSGIFWNNNHPIIYRKFLTLLMIMRATNLWQIFFS